MKRQTTVPLGQLLVESGRITPEQLQAALQEQSRSGRKLGSVLVSAGILEHEQEVIPLVAGQLGIEYAELNGRDIPPAVIELIPAQFALFYKIVPLSRNDTALTVAATEPLNIHLLDDLALIFPGRINTLLAGEKDILDAIRRYYGLGADTIDRMMDSTLLQEADAVPVDDLEDLSDEASIGKFINQIVLEAYKDLATDIHIEPEEDRLQIRYRVDGVLFDAQVPAKVWHFRDSISSRIKIMANLNIAERRLPQDGRFKVKISDVELDLRVSFLPTPYGESIVIRLLSSAKLYSLAELGLAEPQLRLLDGLIRRTHGIVFVTGPTGSGKTTTLYSCLAQLNKSDRKIITIEDPIEYRLKGTTQIQVHPQIGLTFASGLRSMLRHDPDVMMVGEVRDLETAEIAIQIALTGHLVFSTLHTNDAAGSVMRLIDMGVEPYLLAGSVECFIAQRLVRRLCRKCKQPVTLSPETAAEFGVAGIDAAAVTIFESRGCTACNFSGYRGRQGIYEFLVVEEPIRRLIMANASADQILQAALESGMQTMLQDGWQKVLSGITSAAEVLRVVRQQ